MKRTIPHESGRASEPPAGLHLVRVLAYERPHVPGARHALERLAEVVIGRGDRDEVTRSGTTLAVRVDDPRMSQRHARLVREGASWRIEDLGSTNGTFAGGARVERAELEDGSLVELGCTAFLLRSLPAGRSDCDARELAEPLPGLRTFSTSYERELVATERIALTQQSILIHGETGSGKEVVARAIHEASMRSGAFVAVNCGALPPNLVESELFGHRKGAFSGAVEDRVGLVRSADGGTLFLDEIAELPLPSQVALLRVLQQREVTPIGATRPVSVDLRVVAASHRDLEAEIATGRFREDLFSRLAGYTTYVPALRDRREDLGLLIAALLARGPHAVLRFLPEAGRALLQYDWPRNVRELEQVLGSAAALARDGAVDLAQLPRALQEPRRTVATRPAPALGSEDAMRRDRLRALLAEHRGNISAVAREMGVARMQIHRWLERYDIAIAEFRSA